MGILSPFRLVRAILCRMLAGNISRIVLRPGRGSLMSRLRNYAPRVRAKIRVMLGVRFLRG